MAILSEVFEKVAAADPLDSEERILWLNFLNSVIAARDKVVPMAQGQSIVTALSQITNNAGRLTRGEYISPANPIIPYPEDAGFTGVVQDSNGIRGLNSGILQFQLDSADGKAYAGRGALEIDENGISFPQRGSDGLIWGSLYPVSGEYGASISAFNGLVLTMWRYAGGQILSPTDFANEFTGWTNSGAVITTLSGIAENLAYSPSGTNTISQGRFTLGAGNIYMFWGKIKAPYEAYIRIKLYDAPTGGTLIQTTTATMQPSDDFVTFHGFVQAPQDGSANYALFEISLPTDGYASEFSFARVDGASVDLGIYGTYITGDLVMNPGGSISSRLFTVISGGVLSFPGSPYAYVWNESGELYRGPNADMSTGKNRLLTDIDLGSIDSGATLPTSPTANQLFMHTPTGRRVLMLYTNSAWTPLYSFGTMTVYVDGTSGTDAADKGTGTGANAWKTLSYAWTQLPSIFYGNIVINVAAGTYIETLTAQGKTPGGAYTITITGTEGAVDTGTVTTGVQGTGATPGSIQDTSKSWTANEHKGRFVRYGSGALRVIESNTTDTLTIVSTFPGVPSGTYTIVDPDTIIASGGQYGLVFGNNQAVSVSMVDFSGATVREIDANSCVNANATFTNCRLLPNSGVRWIQSSNNIFAFNYCTLRLDGNVTGANMGAGRIRVPGTLLYQMTGSKSGVAIDANGSCAGSSLTFGFVVDNFQNGIYLNDGGSWNFFTSAANGYAVVKNCTNGVLSASHGRALLTTNNRYSGNTTNENSDTSTFGAVGTPSQYLFPNNLFIDGVADEVQGRFQGHSTQTANVVTIESSAAAVQSSFDVNGGAVLNEQGNASAAVRMESDTEPNMFLLDADGDTDGSIQLGGTTNSTKFLKGGRYSHLGTARKTWTKHTAASVTVTAGTSASVVAALQTMTDGSFYTLTEAAATPGMDLIVDFTSVSAFEKCRVLGGYNGVGSHAVAIQVYNWSTATWDTFNAMQVGTWDITTAGGYILGNYEFRVYDDTNYIGTGGDAGKVRVRFYHTMAGNPAHLLYLDEVSLRQ